MKLSEYAKYDAIGLAELVAMKQVTPKELAQTAAKAIATINGEVKAVVVDVEREDAEGAALGLGKTGDVVQRGGECEGDGVAKRNSAHEITAFRHCSLLKT